MTLRSLHELFVATHAKQQSEKAGWVQERPFEFEWPADVLQETPDSEAANGLGVKR